MSNFVVYKSSAGSGKTFTLVKEYLKLALQDEKKIAWAYKRILALTFTNKAAAEMKQRVIDALEEISNQTTPPQIGKIIAEELNISDIELKKRAQFLLSNILHNYSDFSIGTIDSFTHKIVKTFAHDLDLPVNFNLETDVDSFYQKVISELLSKIGEDEYITDLLKEFVLTQAENNASWDPEKNITEFVKLLEKENASYYLDKLKNYTSADLENFRKQYAIFLKEHFIEIKKLALPAIELLSKFNLTFKDFWYKQSGPANFFYKCNDGIVSSTKDLGPRFREGVAKSKWLDTSHEIDKELTSIGQSLIDYIEQNSEQYALSKLLNKQIYQLMLIKKIEEISKARKTEEQIVFISEFNQNIFELINNEPTPFIYERLGEKYHHYLLDEFQDTSGLQWQNILPLLDNSLANGWFNLIVGDGKQSIYRWRNANVKQFANLPLVENPTGSEVVQERINTLNRNYKKANLNTNYRSASTVIEFNNQLFESLSSTLLTGESQGIYEGHTQEIFSKNTGYVSVHTGKTDKAGVDEQNLKIIDEQITSALKSGFNFNDVCIITRKKYHGSIIADYLVAKNIPVISSDSLLLNNNLEVNTIVSFLNYLNNNQDTVSAGAVINYLYQSKQINNKQLSQSLKNIGAHISLFKVLFDLGFKLIKEEFLLRNLLDNCIKIISVLHLNKTNHLYVRFFLDEVNEYLVTKNSNLMQFSQWWENRLKKAAVIIPENSNAVKIMTIHTSKGLEFPVVIVPYCNWEQYKEGDTWVDINSNGTQLPVAVVKLSSGVKEAGLESELEEEKQMQFLDNLNLLYVAFTRASERLHIITLYNAKNTKALISTWIENYLSEKAGKTESGEYVFGEIKTALLKKEKKSSPFTLEPLSFNENNSNVQIKSSYLMDTASVENSKKQGIILHAILSNIKTTNDIDKAVSSSLMDGYITSEEVQNIKTKIISIVAHPALKRFFESDTKTKIESELITSSGDILRPDKIVFAENETVILDYKTGQENNKKYFSQMMSYENALKEIGFSKIKKIIAYIDSGEVVEL